jgi:hypothetical protein
MNVEKDERVVAMESVGERESDEELDTDSERLGGTDEAEASDSEETPEVPSSESDPDAAETESDAPDAPQDPDQED